MSIRENYTLDDVLNALEEEDSDGAYRAMSVLTGLSCDALLEMQEARRKKCSCFINLVDKDVDGCGTDVDTMIMVYGPPVTSDVVTRLQKAVKTYKEETVDWDSDSLFEMAACYLEENGYTVNHVLPMEEICL